MSATTVWKGPVLAQDFQSGPKIRQDGYDRLVIAYDFYREDGSYVWEEMTFSGLVAFSFTFDLYCSEDQIGAYNDLQEVTGSDWAASLVRPPEGLRHYRIYFDDIGCYEVLATTFVPPRLV